MAGCITGVIGLVLVLGFRIGKREVLIGLYAVALLVVLFLLAVLCFLIYEEYWRVDGKICDSFGPVDMHECDEGDTARGYRDLCWVVIAIILCVFLGILLLVPKTLPAAALLERVSFIYRFDLQLHAFIFVILTLGVATYAYFLTLLIYQVSCGDSDWDDTLYLPQGQVYSWSFNEPERVLVFFTVGMALWGFSILFHCVEYVCAYAAKSWGLGNRDGFRITHALRPLLRYHFGSILLASVVIPIGRFPRNLLSGLRKIWSKAPMGPLRYMTSDALCYQAVHGQGSFFHACQSSEELISQSPSIYDSMNTANAMIWMFQLLQLLVAPVYVMYWIQHKSVTYRGKTTKEISSVVAMGLYALVLTWFLAGVLGSMIRGLLHGSALVHSLSDSSQHTENFFESLGEFTKKPVIRPTSPASKPPISRVTQEEQSKNEEDVSVPPPTPPSRQGRHPQEHSIQDSEDRFVGSYEPQPAAALT